MDTFTSNFGFSNTLDGGAWKATVQGVAEGQTRQWLRFHFNALEKEMATHSSVLAWVIPGTEELGGLPSMGSPRVRHNWRDLAAADAPKIYVVLCDKLCTLYLLINHIEILNMI